MQQPIPIPESEEEKGDGTQDLFEVDPDDLLDTDDVVGVDMEKDILDADEDGSLDSLTTVTDEDVMGDELYGQSPLDTSDVQRRKKKAQQAQVIRRVNYPVTLPSQMGGLNT